MCGGVRVWMQSQMVVDHLMGVLFRSCRLHVGAGAKGLIPHADGVLLQDGLLRGFKLGVDWSPLVLQYTRDGGGAHRRGGGRRQAGRRRQSYALSQPPPEYRACF